MKAFYLKVICALCIVVVLLSAAACSNTSDADAYEVLLKGIYGNELVVKLPGQEKYGYMAVSTSSNGEQRISVHEICLERPEFRSRYDGVDIELAASESQYKVGEDITIFFENKGDIVVSHDHRFGLEMLVDGMWKPLGEFATVNGSISAHDVLPGEVYELTVDKTVLARERRYAYSEENGEYELYVDYEYELPLPVGRYRYSKSFSYGDNFVYTECEFEIKK